MAQSFESAKSHFQNGLAYFNQGNYLAAKREFIAAYKLMPERPSILANLSATLIKLEDWEGAQSTCKELLKIEPNDSIGWLNLGVCKSHNGNYRSALEDFNQSLAIDPNYVAAWTNRGHAFQDLERLTEARHSYEKALLLSPNDEDALIGLGNLLNELKQYKDGLNKFDEVIALNPGNHLAKWNKSLSLLRLGNFEEGWRLFESRWHIPGMREFKLTLDAPLWLGKESLAEKTIYIHAEQGFGDTIQFSRFLPMLEKSGAKVIFGVQKPLVNLMRSLSPTIEVLDQKIFLENISKNIDFCCPIMSLALALKVYKDNIPTQTPYLKASTSSVDILGKKLQNVPNKSNTFKIGFTWRGSGKYANKISEKRNIPFNLIANLINEFDSKKIEFHSLQKEFGADTEFQAPKLDKLIMHHDELFDFSDTAALISQLDLVVTVDTAAAHLAGALGVPTLVLLPDPPDFMAQTDCVISPWYPNVQFLRQESRGDWSGPINQAKEKIQFLSERGV